MFVVLEERSMVESIRGIGDPQDNGSGPGSQAASRIGKARFLAKMVGAWKHGRAMGRGPEGLS
jgi:hypothetical protein